MEFLHSYIDSNSTDGMRSRVSPVAKTDEEGDDPTSTDEEDIDVRRDREKSLDEIIDLYSN